MRKGDHEGAGFITDVEAGVDTPKPRAGEHTKGPWRYVQEDNAIVGADGFLISDCIPRSADFGMKERDANARRIVACVNALEGVSLEAIEATQRQYVETKAELDTVLAVLQQLVDGPSGGLGLHESAVVKARAILTKYGR